MSSKVVSAQEGAVHEAPVWRQAGIAPPSAQPADAGDAAELERERAQNAQLRAQLAEHQTGILALTEKARLEGRRSVEAEAARTETLLREELAGLLAANVTELLTARNLMRRQMEEDLVQLAVVVARRVVRRELSVDPEALLGIASAAIGQIEAREIHQLRVAASEAGLMKRLLAERGLPSKINIVADASLGTGSLLFETARGTIDASVEVQLAEIDRGLADVLRRSS